MTRSPTNRLVNPRALAELRLHAARRDAYYAAARLDRDPDDPERRRLWWRAACAYDAAGREYARAVGATDAAGDGK